MANNQQQYNGPRFPYIPNTRMEFLLMHVQDTAPIVRAGSGRNWTYHMDVKGYVTQMEGRGDNRERVYYNYSFRLFDKNAVEAAFLATYLKGAVVMYFGPSEAKRWGTNNENVTYHLDHKHIIEVTSPMIDRNGGSMELATSPNPMIWLDFLASMNNGQVKGSSDKWKQWSGQMWDNSGTYPMVDESQGGQQQAQGGAWGGGQQQAQGGAWSGGQQQAPQGGQQNGQQNQGGTWGGGSWGGGQSGGWGK